MRRSLAVILSTATMVTAAGTQPNRPATASGWRNAAMATWSTTACLQNASANTGPGATRVIRAASRTNTGITIASESSVNAMTMIAMTATAVLSVTAMTTTATIEMIGTVATRGIAMTETGSIKTIRGTEITTANGMIGTAT